MHLLLALLLVFGLPLLGVTLAGKPVLRYLEFPPQTDSVGHAPFSGTAFVFGLLVVCAMTLPVLMRLMRTPRPTVRANHNPGQFPWWGWAGLLWLAAAWVLAWTRFEWFRPLQAYSFTPLWIGYIAIVNALAFKKSGRSLLTHHTRYLLWLFPLSAVFWWSFEYLNRFVQNWHYIGIPNIGPTAYAFHSSISFSTVLPAVMSTAEWLATFPGLRMRAETMWPFEDRQPRLTAATALAAAMVVMLLMGVLPNYFFPFVWTAPLLIIVSLGTLAGRRTVFSALSSGNWTPVIFPAMAALICGFFWELWNVNSLAHWEYSVPWVHRFQIFEMPLLGYAGYLPFGAECAVIAGLIRDEP